MSWTEQRVEQLKGLLAEGLSASQIASEMGGITRNAVIGKAARLGLKLTGHANLHAPRKKREPKPRKVPSPHGNAARLAERISIQGRGKITMLDTTCEPFEAREANVVPLGIGLMQLNEETCRWPIGDGPFTFCGHSPAVGLPYCAGHSRIAYQPLSARPEMSDEERERRRQQGKFNFRKRAMEEA